MTKRASEDVIQRQYVLRKLTRLVQAQRSLSDYGVGYRDALHDVRVFLRGQSTRASKPGGIGRR